MTSLIQAIGYRVIGTVEEVSTAGISALIDFDAPHSTSLNTGPPIGFPRVNGYLLIPNEGGAAVCIVSSVRARAFGSVQSASSLHRDREVGLPFPVRVMSLIPLGTLKAISSDDDLEFRVSRGVDVLPSVGDRVYLPTLDQLQAIVEGQDSSTSRIHIGHSPLAGNTPVYVDPDRLFGRHLAVLGSTGSGKSCSVAGLIRWSLQAAKDSPTMGENCRTPNARFIVLDPNGEYANAFDDLGVRVFQVGSDDVDTSSLRVPGWLWNGSEWAAFAGAAPGVQRPILLESLRYLRAGLGVPDQFERKCRSRTNRHKLVLRIAKNSGKHQKAGQREDAAQDLLNIAEDFSDLAESLECIDTELEDTLKEVKHAAETVESSRRANRKDDGSGYWHNSFSDTQIESVEYALERVLKLLDKDSDDDIGTDENSPIPFPVSELPDFVETLASQQTNRDSAQFVETLKLRIASMLKRGTLSSIINPSDSTSIELADWLKDYVGANQACNGPIAVIDLSLVPSEVIHIVVSVLARMVLEALQRYRRQTSEELPTTLVLEEAHTFVHRDLSNETSSPAARECARVFERIAREGRKFGLGLVLSSQRPSEVSPTVLSQCNTFLLHRLVNDQDQNLMNRLVPDGLGSLLQELPSLPTRRAILLGWAVPAPILVEMQNLAKRDQPDSPDPSFWSVWTGDEDRRIDWQEIAHSWQGNVDSPHEQSVKSATSSHLPTLD